MILRGLPHLFPSEMVDASSDQEPTVEGRNLLSVAHKNVICARRACWRIVSSIEQKEVSKRNKAQLSMTKDYREKIESELAMTSWLSLTSTLFPLPLQASRRCSITRCEFACLISLSVNLPFILGWMITAATLLSLPHTAHPSAILWLS